MDISRSNRDIAPAGENRSVAIPYCGQNNSGKSKYQRWYEALCAKARDQIVPTAYTEIHHIIPRSLGGSDDESNLVRLTYKQHYLAHWLLTKFHTGLNLQKMQRALWAMTLKASGERLTAGWQVEIAKRAVRDMELENDDAASLERFRQRKQEKIAAHSAKTEELIRSWRERDLLEALYFADGYPEPERSSLRARFLTAFKLRYTTEFDRQIIAKWSEASPKALEEAHGIATFGRRDYLAIKRHRLERERAKRTAASG